MFENGPQWDKEAKRIGYIGTYRLRGLCSFSFACVFVAWSLYCPYVSVLSALVMFHFTADSIRRGHLCGLIMCGAPSVVSVHFICCWSFLFNCLNYALFSGEL